MYLDFQVGVQMIGECPLLCGNSYFISELSLLDLLCGNSQTSSLNSACWICHCWKVISLGL